MRDIITQPGCQVKIPTVMHYYLPWHESNGPSTNNGGNSRIGSSTKKIAEAEQMFSTNVTC